MLQVPILKEVTDTVRSNDFWASFLRRFTNVGIEFANTYNQLFDRDTVAQWSEFAAATVIAKDYPTARDFLHEAAGMSDEQLDRYPKAQVVFLALVKYNEMALDETLKQIVVPFANLPDEGESDLLKYWSSRFAPAPFRPDLRKSLLSFGDVLRPGTRQVIDAKASVDQHQNLWQTVEAIRLTAAENGGKLPQSLDQLVVPAPLDPATNRPFQYERDGDVATLRATNIGWRHFEIKLELANQGEQKEQVK